MTLMAGGMALAMLSACHRSNNRNTGMEGTSSVTQVNSENIQPERLDNWADLRRPDVKIPLRRICNPTLLNIRICNPQNIDLQLAKHYKTLAKELMLAD